MKIQKCSKCKCYRALKRLIYHPFTLTRDREMERRYWKREKTLGNGEAQHMLYALKALDEAEGK